MLNRFVNVCVEGVFPHATAGGMRGRRTASDPLAGTEAGVARNLAGAVFRAPNLLVHRLNYSRRKSCS